MDISALSQGVLEGNRLALARAITQVENDSDGGAQLLAALHPHTGKAHYVGVTGSPGSGKSTLVNALARALRRLGVTLAIVAVDPTSPFSGGAILGDRIRMHELAGDQGVFIRSMATRGSLGGLARTTSNVVSVLDAAGFNLIFIETVGAGQSEVDIARAAHTTLVIEPPGLGDDIQAIKAGILEIADILVVSKADHPYADSTVRFLQAMLEMSTPHGSSSTREASDLWPVPVVKVIAPQGEGIEEVLGIIERHRAHLVKTSTLTLRERERVAVALKNHLHSVMLERLTSAIGLDEIDLAIDEVLARSIDPHSAALRLIKRVQLVPRTIFHD